MTKPINFQKNSRYKSLLKKTILYKEIENLPIKKNNKNSPFVVEPPFLQFHHFQPNKTFTKSIKIINRDDQIRRLKFLPPKTENFKILKVNMPSKTSTQIAPGNCIEFIIEFQGDRRKDYKDAIGVISEKDYFFFKLHAKIEKPNLSIKETLQCQTCWFGRNSYTEFKIKNRGGYGNFNITFRNPRQSIFKLSDAEFNLSKNEYFRFSIIFQPDEPGMHNQEIIIKNEEDYEVQSVITSQANLVDLRCIQINETEVVKKENKHKIKFNNCETYCEYSQTIKFKNYTDQKIKFHWNFMWKDKIHKKVYHSLLKLEDTSQQRQTQNLSQDQDLNLQSSNQSDQNINLKENQNMQKLKLKQKDLRSLLYKAKSLGEENLKSVNFLKKVLTFTEGMEIPIDFLKNEEQKLFLKADKNEEQNQPTNQSLFPLKQQLDSIREDYNQENKNESNLIFDNILQLFRIYPYKGVFGPNEEKEFKINFSAIIHPGSYSILLQQLLLEVPTSALQSNHKKLKKEFGVLNQQFNIKSYIKNKEFQLSPVEVTIPEQLLIKVEHQVTVEIKIKYEIYDFLTVSPDIDSQYINSYIDTIERISEKITEDSPSQKEEGLEKNQSLILQYKKEELLDFRVEPNDIWRLNFKILSTKLGSYEIRYRIKLENSLEKVFKVRLNFKPPELNVSQDKIQLEIFPLKSNQVFFVELTNKSEIAETVFLLNRDKASFVEVNEIFQLCKNNTQSNELLDIFKRNNDQILKIENQYLYLEPHQVQRVYFHIFGAKTGKFEKQIQIFTSNKGFYQNIDIRGDIQEPDLQIQNNEIQLKDIFVEKQYKQTNDKENKLLKIYNPNAFDLQYSIIFNEDYDPEIHDFKFHPQSGILVSNEKKFIKYKLKIKEVGDLRCPFFIKYKPYQELNYEKKQKKIKICFEKRDDEEVIEIPEEQKA